MGIVFAVFLICLIVVISVIVNVKNSRPLTKEEILDFAVRKRAISICRFYNFKSYKFNVNPNYRSGINPDGRWDIISLPISDVFAFSASLLRYKRHEWQLWYLCEGKTCKFLWANKGDDNSSCYFKGNFAQLILLAAENNCDTIIMVHNHPQHAQNREYYLLQPSETDLNTSDGNSKTFNPMKINYIDAVCSTGSFYIYNMSFSESLFPLKNFVDDIKSKNDISKKGNRKLRKEYKVFKKVRGNFYSSFYREVKSKSCTSMFFAG